MSQILIPVIDIQGFINGTGKGRIAKEVGQCCKEFGFLIISGHGISPVLIDESNEVAKEFFALTAEEKMKVYKTGKGRGYIPTEFESLGNTIDVNVPADLKETFNIGADDGKNLWPSNPTRLKHLWTKYYDEMTNLAKTLMRIFAVSLDITEDFFDNKIDTPNAILRATHYPPITQPPLPGQLRVGAHTDYGTLSILRLDPKYGGFQVHVNNLGWIDVNSVPDCFAINIGDLMMHWTNDYWKSTLHRVVNPPSSDWSSSRLSLVFLHNPNPMTEVSCIEKFCSPIVPAKYPTVLAGEYLSSKSSKSRKDN